MGLCGCQDLGWVGIREFSLKSAEFAVCSELIPCLTRISCFAKTDRPDWQHCFTAVKNVLHFPVDLDHSIHRVPTLLSKRWAVLPHFFLPSFPTYRFGKGLNPWTSGTGIPMQAFGFT